MALNQQQTTDDSHEHDNPDAVSDWLHNGVPFEYRERITRFGGMKTDSVAYTSTYDLIQSHKLDNGTGRRLNIVDIGCLVGDKTRELAIATGARVMGIDVVKKNIDNARTIAGEDPLQLDIQYEYLQPSYVDNGVTQGHREIPKFEDTEGYDAAVLTFVVQTIPEPSQVEEVFKTAYKSLRPGGIIVISGLNPDALGVIGYNNYEQPHIPLPEGRYNGQIFDNILIPEGEKPVHLRDVFYEIPFVKKLLYISGFRNANHLVPTKGISSSQPGMANFAQVVKGLEEMGLNVEKEFGTDALGLHALIFARKPLES